jgi:quercetin dioxygenase-like cupin family protein
VTGFQPFFNAATGEWIEYTNVAGDTGGALIRFNWRSVPGGKITEHVHPHQEERCIVLAGEACCTLDGQQCVARAGETVVVPAGVRHSEGNPGPGEVTAVVELRPAQRTKESHEAVAGLVADGRTTRRGAPKKVAVPEWHGVPRGQDRVGTGPSAVTPKPHLGPQQPGRRQFPGQGPEEPSLPAAQSYHPSRGALLS